MPLFKTYEKESPKFTEFGLQMRNINTKNLNLAIFQKLIFGIFTAIFVKNGGEKETKLDIMAKILNYRKIAKGKIFLILCLNSEINFNFFTFLEHWFK